MAVVSITYTVKDAKGKDSTMTIYSTDDGNDLIALANAVKFMGNTIAKLINGTITGASLCLNLNLTASDLPDGNATPLAGADVEEGAMFIFNTDTGFTKRNRIPTFKESLILAGTQAVDIAHPDVDAFLTATQNGVLVEGEGDTPGVPTVTIQFNDQRGDDIAGTGSGGFNDAYEMFQSSGSRRR